MSAQTLIRFFDAGAYECQIDGCECPFAYVSWKEETDRYGDDRLFVVFECQWGHTATLSLQQRKGEALYHVEVETDPEMVA